MHPSKRFKTVSISVGICGMIAAVALLVNQVTVKDETIRTFGQMGLLFVANMLVALAARSAVGRAVWPSAPLRTTVAYALVFAYAVLLLADYSISDNIVGGSEPLQDATATLAAAVVWVGAYAVAWKPFLQRKENRALSAGLSLVLGFIAFVLYFRTLFATALFDGVGWKSGFIEYALSCIAFAAVASSFMVQKDEQEEQKKQEMIDGFAQSEIVVSYFEPSCDFEKAERFVSKGMLFEEDVKSGFAVWIYGRDVVCDAMSNATKLYAARYRGELAGLLFANDSKTKSPYAKSGYALFHRAFALLSSIASGGNGADPYDRARSKLIASVDIPLDVEISLFITDPELKGKGVGSKLLDAFESDFPECTAFLVADGTLSTAFFQKRGFSLVAEKSLEMGCGQCEPEERCRLLIKQIVGSALNAKANEKQEKVWLEPLKESDREQFILDNQEAFDYGAMEEFGLRNDDFEEDGQIISRETIEASIDGGDTWRIVRDGEIVGGAVVSIEGDRGELESLFVRPDAHSKGIGYVAWCAIEKRYPNVRVWGLVTPYFETRNIHFYVNCCGFHIVEFYNSHHPEPAMTHDGREYDGCRGDECESMDFRFEKAMLR